MPTRLTLKPGQKGTKKLLAQYGEQLVCVRYHYDAQRQKRLKTVELIIEEVEWKPKLKPPAGQTMMAIRVAWGESEIAWRVKRAGGRWNAERKVWELRYEQVAALGLEERIVGELSI